MNIRRAIGETVKTSVAIISTHAYSLGLFSVPYYPDFVGEETQSWSAQAPEPKATFRKTEMTGLVGVLPGVPAERKRRSSAARKSSLEKETVMRRFDRAFGQMLSRRGQPSRLEAIERIKPMIYALSPEIRAWTGDARIRVYMVMKELADDLDDPACAKASIGVLVLILLKGGKSAVEMAKPIFGEKIHKMYNDPKYEGERFLPRLLLMLDDYAPERVATVTKEAIHLWGNDRFRAANCYLGLDELTERGLRSNIKGILGAEIANAGFERDATALNRAIELYHQVK